MLAGYPYFWHMKAWLLRIFSGKYLFHLIVWLVYGVYNLMNVEDYIHKKGWLFTLPALGISIVLLAMLIYVNAFLLVPKLLDRKRVGLYLLSVLLLVVLNTWLKSLSQQYYDYLTWPTDPMTLRSYFKWNLFNSFWSILISTLLLYSLRWSQQRQQVRNIELEQLQTELKYLRSQLNPHFLFNGLNTIYGNIDRDNEVARNVLVQFSDLLRYNLYEADVDLIELGREAAYLENYVAIQKARSNANLRIGLTVQIADPGVKIAPLIFIAFVENAFKFITREDNTLNFVDISLVQEAGEIFFSCVNSYEAGGGRVGGIGLKNVTRRLDLLYKGRYRLDIRQENSVYSVNLVMSI
jgi:two-component system LytT family sensor kinase